MPRLTPLRAVALSISLLVLALFGYAGYLLYWAHAAQPGLPGAAAAALQRRAAEAQASLPEGPDAWPLFASLLDTAAKAEISFNARFPTDPPADWPKGADYPVAPSAVLSLQPDPRTIEHLPALLEAHRATGVFDRLDQLTRSYRALRPPGEGRLIDIVVPELTPARSLARLNAARMKLAADTGDNAERLRALEHNLAIARVLAYQPTLIERLVSTAIISLSLTELRQGLLERPLNETELAEALALLDRQLLRPPLSYALGNERLFFEDVVQWTHTDDGNGDGCFLPYELAANPLAGAAGIAAPAPSKITNVLGRFAPTKKETLALAADYYDNTARLADLPPAERRADPFKPDVFVETLAKQHAVLGLFLPAFGSAVQSEDAISAQIAGTRLMLAIELHRARRGDYPNSLTDLDPATLSPVPTDPFNPAGFAYWRTEPGSDSAGRPYLFYSKGQDQQDNKGAHSDSAFGRHAGAAGADYVLNTPRQPAAKP